MDQPTDSMALRWFDIGEWKKHRLGFPNYGKRGKSANPDCRELAVEVQKMVQSICRSPEAGLPRAPEKGTVIMIIELIRRVNVLIGSRLIKSSDIRTPLPYNNPAYESFFIYPAPLWNLENEKMRGLAMRALRATQAVMHHGDNQLEGGFTPKFQKDIWPTFRQIHDTICTEVIGLTVEELPADNLLIDVSHPKLVDYNPKAYQYSNEEWWGLSGVPALSPDSWHAMTVGMPTDLIPPCPEYPMSAPIAAAGGTGDGSLLSENALNGVAAKTGAATTNGGVYPLDTP